MKTKNKKIAQKTPEKSDEIVFLKGKHVSLRPIEKEHIKYFLRWFNDQEVAHYITVFLPMTKGEEEKWVEELTNKKHTDITLLIVAENNTPIGNLGLHRIDARNRTATLGITIGDKNYWGRGYGSEAIELLLSYAFNTLNLRKVCLSVIDFNERAIRCYEKCGFRVEGRLREQLFRNGEYRDEVMMAIFERDWWQQKK